MLPIFQKIEANIDHSFYVDHIRFKYFPNPLHFHPEIEILLVIEGTGTRFVGDSVERFGPGSFVMIGQNVPHLWHSDEKYFKKNSLNSEVIYILFNTEFFGKDFWQMAETTQINKLLELSQRGIKLTLQHHDELIELMKSIVKSSGVRRIILLLLILEKIALAKNYQLLASSVIQKNISDIDSDRLNNVYKFVINNFQRHISLEQVSEAANLSVPAFCRYFKKRTNKTFVQFLNEIRISNACKLLTEEKQSIGSICYNSGFNNISFFIKQFKKITGFTPLAYKKKYKD